MNTHDEIHDEQCRTCGGCINGDGFFDDPDQDGFGDAAYYHATCHA